MLVLSRKQGQTIQIGDQVTITITQLKGKQVRIGIDAPKDIKIRRGEIGNVNDQENLTGGVMPSIELDPASQVITCSF